MDRALVHCVLGSVPADGPYVVYALYDEGNQWHVRYVGYSHRPELRLIEHVQEANRGHSQSWKSRWIRSVLTSGRSVLWRPLRFASCRSEASFLEKAFVRGYRFSGHRLTNGTDGGDGGLLTPEARAKQSAAMKLLIKTKPESRARMTAALHSEKARINLRAAMQTPSIREKHRLKNLGRKHSLEIRQKLSESQKRRWQNTVLSEEDHLRRSTATKLWWERRKAEHPEEVVRQFEKSGAANRGHKHTDEFKAKCAERSRAKTGWHHSDEAKRKQSIAHKLYWQKWREDHQR